MADFKDYFSELAKGYARYRPTYPLTLVEFLASVSPDLKLAWDAGCGSGQLSTLLASQFEKVIAQDASQSQIDNATPHPRVEYSCANFDHSGIPDHTVSLAVAAQAAHWFDLPLYYREVKRVLKNKGILALITYGRMHISPDIDHVIGEFHEQVLGPYWPSERRFVEEGYASFPFPFEELQAPTLEIIQHWSLKQLIGYVNTSSAVNALKKDKGDDAFNYFCEKIATWWGPPETLHFIRWPLHLRVGRLSV